MKIVTSDGEAEGGMTRLVQGGHRELRRAAAAEVWWKGSRAGAAGGRSTAGLTGGRATRVGRGLEGLQVSQGKEGTTAAHPSGASTSS